MNYARGAFVWDSTQTVGTTTSITSLSFQPVALRFSTLGWVTGIDLDGEATAYSYRRCVGFATSTSDRRCVGSQDADNQGSMLCAALYRTDCVVAVTEDTTRTLSGLLDLDAILSNGFRVIVDDSLAANQIVVFWEAWGGSDITVAVTGEIAEPATAVAVDYTATGLTSGGTDQVVMFAGCQATSAAQALDTTDSGFCIGFATDATHECCVIGNDDDGSANSDTDGYCASDLCLGMIAVAGGNATARATFTQYNANGFRLTWAARAVTGRKYIFMALKGGNWQAGGLTIAGNTLNSTAAVSGLSWTPIGISLVGRMTAAQAAGTSTVEDRMAIGMGTSTTDRISMGFHSLDSAGTSDIASTFQLDQVLCYPTASTGVLLTAYDISSMDSGGFTLINDLAGGVASEFIGYLTFGGVAVSNTSFTPTVGSIAISSDAAVRSVGRVPSIGSLALTATAPVVPILHPDTATLALTATNPIRSIGFVTSTGTLTASGIQGSIFIATQVTPSAGSLTTAGIQISRLDEGVTPLVATLTLTGTQSVRATTLMPSAGALTATGNQATEGLNIAPTSATLALAGISGRLDVAVNVSTGTMTLVGQSPRADLSVALSVGTLILAGIAPSLLVDTRLVISAGTLALTASDPFTDHGLALFVGSLTLSGIAPTVETGGVTDTPLMVGAGHLQTVRFPTTSVLDNFNRADEGPPPSTQWTHLNWFGGADLKVVSSVVVPENNVDDCLDVWNPATFGPDVEAYATVSNLEYSAGLSSQIILCLRVTDPTGSPTGYIVSFSADIGVSLDTPCSIGRHFLPNETVTIASTTIPRVVNGDQVGASVVGGVVFVFVNGVLQFSGTDSTYSTAGNIGLDLSNLGTAAGIAVDNFGGGTAITSAPTVSVNTFLTASAASLAWSGLAPVLSAVLDTPIMVAVGTLSLSASIPVEDGGRIPSVGSLSASSEAPIALVNTFLTIAAGSVTLTGIVPILSAVFDTTISVSAGSAEFTGTSPTLLVATFIAPASASLATSGSTSPLNQGLIPSSAALTLTSSAPALGTSAVAPVGALALVGIEGRLDLAIIPSNALATIAGTASTLAIPVMVTATTGTLALTGSFAVIQGANQYTPDVGALTLTSAAPVIAFTVTPLVGTLDLTGATSRLDYATTPLVASLALIGIQASLLQVALATPSVAALTLTGTASAVSQSSLIRPSVAALVTTASTAILDRGVFPPAGTVTLSGSAPTLAGAATNIAPNPAALLIANDASRLNLGVTSIIGSLTATSIQGSIIRSTVTLRQTVVGSLAFTGIQGIRSAGRVPDTATLTLAVSSPTQNLSIRPDVASLSASGVAPVRSVGRVTTAGTLTLAGIQAVKGLGLVPSIGTLTLVASSPSPLISLTPATAALALSGAQPNLGGSLRPAIAALILTASSPALEFRTSPLVGTLTLTASTPTARAAYSLMVGGGALTLIADTPFFSGSLRPVSGALTLDGQAIAAIKIDLPLLIEGESLTLDGLQVGRIAPIIPDTATLTIEGAIAYGVAIKPARAQLRFTGHSPSIRKFSLILFSSEAWNLAGFSSEASGIARFESDAGIVGTFQAETELVSGGH